MRKTSGQTAVGALFGDATSLANAKRKRATIGAVKTARRRFLRMMKRQREAEPVGRTERRVGAAPSSGVFASTQR